MISSTYPNTSVASPHGRRLRFLPVLFLFVCAGLILGDNLVNIGRTLDELTKFYVIWRLTPLDFGLGILFLWGAFHLRELRKFLWKPPVLVLIAAIGFETMVGLLRPAESEVSWLLFDLRILLCLFGGVIMGSIMVRTGRFLRLIAGFAIVTTALFIYAGTSTELFKNAILEGLGSIRVADPNIFYYWEFLLIPCGILGVRRGATTSLERVAFWLSLVALLVLGVVVSATRSCLLVFGIMLVLLFLVWIKQAEVKGVKSIVKGCVVAVTVAAAYYFAYVMLKPAERAMISKVDWNSFAVVDRVQEADETDENLNQRGQEVRQLLLEMRPIDYVFGKGLGATLALPGVRSTESTEVAGGMERVPGLHISIFNFLLKFGGLGFLLVLFLVLVWWPAAFVRALLKRDRDRGSRAALACYPAVGAATSLMFMSGGFTPQMFLWFGVAYAYFIDTKTSGSKAVGGENAKSAA